MHARLLHMYSLLKDDYYWVKTDNLFTAVKIAREAYAAFKVLTDGVIRRSGRGVPRCVFQDEKKGKKAEEARGTLKAAVLKGDSKSCDLVVVSN